MCMTCQMKRHDILRYTAHFTCCKYFSDFFESCIGLGVYLKLPSRVHKVEWLSCQFDLKYFGAESELSPGSLERRFKDSCLSLCSPASSHLAAL